VTKKYFFVTPFSALKTFVVFADFPKLIDMPSKKKISASILSGRGGTIYVNSKA